MNADRATLLRQWNILRLIPRHPGKTTARIVLDELARQGFVVTKRTVERDVNNLSAVFPLVSDTRNKPFGWSWHKDAPALDIPSLALDEALSLDLVGRFLQNLVPRTLLDTYRRRHDAIIQSRLRDLPRGRGYIAWADKVRVVPASQPLLPPEVDPKIHREVSEALLLDRCLKITYERRGNKQLVKWQVHPLGLVQRGPVAYVVCTIAEFNDPRLLALHRIHSAQMTDEPSHRPKNFNFDTWLAAGALGFGDGKTIRLKALFSTEAAEHLYETPLGRDQRIRTAKNKQVEVTATVADTPQLRWWLLGFGDAVEVLNPKALREEIISIVRASVSRYAINDL